MAGFADFGDALMQIGAVAQGPQALESYNRLPLLQAQGVSQQLENQQRQSALAKLAEIVQSGERDPIKIQAALATVDPSFLKDAAEYADPYRAQRIRGSMPSSLQELAYLDTIRGTPKEAEYWRNKRADQQVDLGDKIVFRDPAGNFTAPLPIELKPGERPNVRGDQAKETEKGKIIGQTEGAIDKKSIQAPQINEYLNEAEKLLPNATSGGLASTGKAVAGYFGHATAGSEADSQLNIIASALTMGVPRMEGPQSDKDTVLYKQAAGDLANSSLPIKTRQAALKQLRALNDKYLTLNSDEGAPAPKTQGSSNTASPEAIAKLIAKAKAGKK